MDMSAEWIETDGLGGFASGTVSGIRSRRYHAILLTATMPPRGRMVLVNGFDAWIETPAASFPLSSQYYAPGMTHPHGMRYIAAFTLDPWPHWRFDLPDHIQIEQQLFVTHGSSMAVLSWRLLTPHDGVVLSVRPFLSGRDFHALHRENPSFRFDPVEAGTGLNRWRPYPGSPDIVSLTNGTYTHQPDWYRNFLYTEEQARGLDDIEDLATPGVYRWTLSGQEAVWIVAAQSHGTAPLLSGPTPLVHVDRLRTAERARRRGFSSRLEQAGDAYIVRRGNGKTIMAGYPWFGDWGRDTFIALRGLCLATGRLDDARAILLEWARTVSEGMLPNCFPDQGSEAEYNSVDAALWYVIAVHEFFQSIAATKGSLAGHERAALLGATEQILNGYARGTRYGIRLDDDGLLACGMPGVQLTWMDAKVDGRVVTPRIGKPVEIQALWVNALAIGSEHAPAWKDVCTRAKNTFHARFWNSDGNCLYDVIDVDHHAGTTDASLRPNQIFAVGGLPFPLLKGTRARMVVDAVETALLTPLGLRTLAPGEPDYHPRYEGGQRERDGAYHQGTVWPWLLGAFVEAWVRVRGSTVKARRKARERFLSPLLGHMDEAGLNHISEIADAEPPHRPRGCPFQAWSVGEALRLDAIVLAGKRPDGRSSSMHT